MSGLLEKAEKNLNLALDTIANVAEHFAEKTQETAKVTHMRVRVRRDQHTMSKLLSSFGVLVYGKVVKKKTLTLDSPEVQELAGKIAAVEKQIEASLSAIEKLTGSVQASKKPAASGKRKSPAASAVKKPAPKRTAKKPAAKKAKEK